MIQKETGQEKEKNQPKNRQAASTTTSQSPDNQNNTTTKTAQHKRTKGTNQNSICESATTPEDNQGQPFGVVHSVGKVARYTRQCADTTDIYQDIPVESPKPGKVWSHSLQSD